MTKTDISRRAIWAGALAAVGAAALARPAAAIELTAMPLDQHGYRPAPTLEDTVGWEVLGATTTVERMRNGYPWQFPQFTDRVRAMNGRRIKVNGFMNPLETAQRQRQFLLMAYPISCPFCLDVGAQFFIYVVAATPVRYTVDAVVIEGVLELLNESEEGLFYRMTDARQVR